MAPAANQKFGKNKPNHRPGAGTVLWWNKIDTASPAGPIAAEVKAAKVVFPNVLGTTRMKNVIQTTIEELP